MRALRAAAALLRARPVTALALQSAAMRPMAAWRPMAAKAETREQKGDGIITLRAALGLGGALALANVCGALYD